MEGGGAEGVLRHEVLNGVQHQTPQPATGGGEGTRSVTYSTMFILNGLSVSCLNLPLIFPGEINTCKNSTKFEYTFGKHLLLEALMGGGGGGGELALPQVS